MCLTPSLEDLKAVGGGWGTTPPKFSQGRYTTKQTLITQGWTGREAAFNKTPGHVSGAC